jgi:tRNA-dihydrouridine synthase
MTPTINTGIGPAKNQPFFEVRTTKEGTQYMAVRGDIEVSGFTTSRTRAVVERIVERVFEASREPPPEVSTVADRLTDYVELMIKQFRTEYVSTSVTIKAGDVKMTLGIYLTYYSDEKVSEWRGNVEALSEGKDGKKSEGRHLVKRRVVFADDVSAFKIYRELMTVARHAYNALASEE